MRQMWIFPRATSTTQPQTSHLLESWQIPSIDAPLLPATAKRRITYIDVNEGLERIVGACQWSSNSWNV
jgi:hypothetical protein